MCTDSGPTKPARAPIAALVDVGVRLTRLREEAALHRVIVEDATVSDGCAARAAGAAIGRCASAGRRVATAQGRTRRYLAAGVDTVAGRRRARRNAGRLRHGPDGAAPADQRSACVAPLRAQGKLLGCLYADIEGASAASTTPIWSGCTSWLRTCAAALDNAQWAQGLRHQAEQDALALRQALEQQTATGRGPESHQQLAADTQPVFEAIARNAATLCSGMFANVVLFDGAHAEPGRHQPHRPRVRQAAEQAATRWRPMPSLASGRVVLTKAVRASARCVGRSVLRLRPWPWPANGGACSARHCCTKAPCSASSSSRCGRGRARYRRITSSCSRPSPTRP